MTDEHTSTTTPLSAASSSSSQKIPSGESDVDKAITSPVVSTTPATTTTTTTSSSPSTSRKSSDSSLSQAQSATVLSPRDAELVRGTRSKVTFKHAEERDMQRVDARSTATGSIPDIGSFRRWTQHDSLRPHLLEQDGQHRPALTASSLPPPSIRNPTIQTTNPSDSVPKTFLSPLRTMTPKSRAKSVFLQYTEGKTPRDLQRETLRMAFTPNQNPTETSPNFINAPRVLTGEIVPRDLTFDTRSDYDKRLVVKRPKVKKNFRINQVGAPVEFKNQVIYFLMKSMQLGVKTLIDRIYERPKRELTPGDFKAKVKVNFPSSGSDTTPTHNYPTFEFKDFHPMTFRHVRDIFGVDHGEYISSLCSAESLTILGTPGKSSALFFFSFNTRYILKTVTKREAKMLTKILPHYLEHIRTNPDTLLCRFYGLHRVKATGKKSVRFVVMNNVFHTHLKIHEKYDLKGSTQGRYAKDKNDPSAILKDLDMNSHIKIGKDKTKKILLQIAKDCRFLANHGIMDYSMLIGMHYESKANPAESFVVSGTTNASNSDGENNDRRNSLTTASGPTSPINLRSSLSWFDTKEPRRSIFQNDGGGCRSTEDESGGAIIYFFGIIDILQEYNPRKRAERFFKSLRYSSSKISVAMPHFYSLRFQEFMRKVIVDVDQEEQDGVESYLDYDPRFQVTRSNTSVDFREELWPESHEKTEEAVPPKTARVESAPHLRG